MNIEFTKYIAELLSGFIELLADIVIAGAIITIIFNYVVRLFRKNQDKFNLWRNRSWKGIQGALDLFVAADLVNTITIDRNFNAIITLGVLILIRTFVSWSLEIEFDGCWPWQRKRFEYKEKLLNIKRAEKI